MRNKKKYLDEIIRVNHAGEYGAQVIYKSQIKFCKNKKLREQLKKIASEEKIHFDYFDNQIISKRTRPTIMQPVWKAGGTALGIVSSLLGEKYIHACTEAIENTIVDHYKKQIEYLDKYKIEKDLKKKIKKFCEEENNHKINSEKKNSNEPPVVIFKKVTTMVTKLAIKVSKKI